MQDCERPDFKIPTKNPQPAPAVRGHGRRAGPVPAAGAGPGREGESSPGSREPARRAAV
jgi:hypothetical protein